jgi:2-keto-4-pentenoate hydratase/2-oxohepta-3-ene-1,7-dioic acid hydratase in catechol pathway
LGLSVDAMGRPGPGVTFRFANVGGRSALVDSAGHWFDASRVSGGAISADPMAAWLHQDDRTSNLIFDVPTLISYLSDILTLSPGDLTFTGTPEGVGAASLRFRSDGDLITTTIEGIGTLHNPCRVPQGSHP